MEKKIIQVRVDKNYSIDFDGLSVDDILYEVSSFKQKHAENYLAIVGRLISTCGCRHHCSCSQELAFFGNRLETDEECHTRMAAIAILEEGRRKEYERLKLHFEGK